MKYIKAKYSIIGVMAGLLFCQPISASAAIFADLDQVPWVGAETSINKAAELGLVVGETINGQTCFRPKDSVSLSECCQLAYKLLMQTQKASADDSLTEKWAIIMNTYDIQDWAKPAVSFCLENGIIQISDLNDFVKNGVNATATRERAASILGHALISGVPSYSADAASTSFGDNSSISAEAKPYIALLNEVGVINGDDFGNFNPKSTLNRTETAVLVTNLYEVLNEAEGTADASYQNGIVNSMNSVYINFEDSSSYYIYASENIPVTLNGEISSVSEVVSYFTVGYTVEASLTLNSDNRVTAMVASCEAAEKETEGILTKVLYDEDYNDGYIVIDGEYIYEFEDADDVDIEIDGDDYDMEEFYELFEECEEDDIEIEVTVTLDSDDYLIAIEGTMEESDDDEDDDTVKGEVSSMKYDEEEEEGYIKIGSTKYYVEDTDDVTVKIDGSTEDYEELFELYEDDEYLYVTLTLDSDDYITKIVASTEEEDEEVEGEIDEIDDDYIEIDGEEYDLDSGVDIDIENGDDTIDNLDDLIEAVEAGFVIEVTALVEDDEVTEIAGEVVEVTGYLLDYDDDEAEIETDWNDFVYEFEDSDDYDDFEDDVEELMDEEDLNVDEIEVTFTLEDGKIVDYSLDY